MKLKATISDAGVGLMEGQILYYQWYANDIPLGSKTGLHFNNKNYEGSKTKPILTPGDISKPTETTIYTLEVTGTLEDVDGNTNPIHKKYYYKYFIGTAHIRFIANGGAMASEHDSSLSVGNNGYVYYSSNAIAEQTVRYNQSLSDAGLWNYNNPGWLNLIRTGYHIDNTKEWKSSNGVHSIYDDDKKDYKDTDFCTNLRTDDCYVDLYANWIINTYTLTYNNEGGSGCSTKTAEHGSKWGTLCTPTKKYHKFEGWYTKKDGKGSQITSDGVATSNVSVYAKWTYIECLSDNIIVDINLDSKKRQKIKDKKSIKGIIDATTYKWSNPKEHCDGSEPKRVYNFQEIGCFCNIDKNTKNYCSVKSWEDFTSITHPKGHATIYYEDSNDGRAACRGTKGYNVNSYVKQVCDGGKYEHKKDTYFIYHGYYFYKNGVGSFNSFHPTDAWTHSGRDADRDTRVSSSKDAETACVYACKANH